jgi:hypothetical protein
MGSLDPYRLVLGHTAGGMVWRTYIQMAAPTNDSLEHVGAGGCIPYTDSSPLLRIGNQGSLNVKNLLT